jgi:hypothetical protein
MEVPRPPRLTETDDWIGTPQAMKHLTTAANQPEAESISSMLRSAGIAAVIQGDAALAWRAPAIRGRDIYVEEEDLDRARELLNSGGGISEAELIEAEEADATARATERQMQPPASGAAPSSASKQPLWARLHRRNQW